MCSVPRRSGFSVLLLLILLSVVASPAYATPPAQSLDRCQKVVGDEGTRFITDVKRVVGRCLEKISDQTVRKERADVAPAARSCTSAFGEIFGSRGGTSLQAELESRIARWCTPGQAGVTHSTGDVLGVGAIVGEPLGVKNLDSWCAALGGDGSIDSVDEWIACVVEAHWLAAATALASEFPRALEWLSKIRDAMLATPGSSDAVTALDFLASQIAASQDGAAELPASGQLISYAPGDDGELRTGAELRFSDNGDGTITDETTGLVWEKKSDDGGLHDKDMGFVWEPGAGSLWEWLAKVNAEGGAGFAGKSDWRIPNKKELESVVDAAKFNPAFPAVFATGCAPGCPAKSCSCIGTLLHQWTSTSVAAAPTTFAWSMLPSSGAVVATNRKTQPGHARAVRGP